MKKERTLARISSATEKGYRIKPARVNAQGKTEEKRGTHRGGDQEGSKYGQGRSGEGHSLKKTREGGELRRRSQTSGLFRGNDREPCRQKRKKGEKTAKCVVGGLLGGGGGGVVLGWGGGGGGGWWGVGFVWRVGWGFWGVGGVGGVGAFEMLSQKRE